MKAALPENAKISKEAKECMQECVSEFISFVTSEATERCSAERRKTVNGEDILFALMSLGFENYSEVLKIYLAKYRHVSWKKIVMVGVEIFANCLFRAKQGKMLNSARARKKTRRARMKKTRTATARPLLSREGPNTIYFIF